MSDAGSTEDDPAVFHDQLEDVEAEIESAETEADLDTIDARLAEIAKDLEEATFPQPPEPEDEDEDELPDPAEEIEDRLSDDQDAVEELRGPYADDIVAILSTEESTIETTEWAQEGTVEVTEAVEELVGEAGAILDNSIEIPIENTVESQTAGISTVIEAIEQADLDPDEDATVIEAGLEAAETFSTAIDEATAFGDLQVREQLNRKGFFDILGHYKDFPPEWSAIKAHEQAGNVEMILLAFDLLDSNFMEEHCITALRRLGDEAAIEPMMALSKRRNQDAIEVLGKIGSEEPVDQLLGFVDTASDPQLQQVTMKALGEIGSADAVEVIAQQLKAENAAVRSSAARSLGMIGDTRAIAPLSDVLEDDEVDFVRGSAAWALVEIGTKDAFDTVLTYEQDGSYLVESEVEKITTLDATS